MPTEPRTIKLPNDWAPRPYQKNLWNYLEKTTAAGKPARAVQVAHRRWGKDSVALNWAAVAAMQRVGLIYHLAPEMKHVRKIVWDGIDSAGRRMIDQAFPKEIVESRHENEMKIRLANGSMWQCCGSDSFDSLVGSNPVGLIFSEASLADPTSWQYLRPILAENKGWAIFISTPRGQNWFCDLYNMAKDSPDWHAELQTATDTNAITADAIEMERQAGMPESLIKQEFMCSFTSSIAGAFYADYLDKAQEEGRIGSVPWEPASQCYTAWDLGVDDSTFVWIYQRVRKEIRLIDTIEGSGVGLEWYAKELDRKPYTYGGHSYPHDVAVRELGTGRSRLETLRSMGLGGNVVPKLSVEDGIAAVRSILGRCWFDEQKCARGIKALRSYRTEYNPKAGVFSPKPLHDWSSHGSDSFRYLAVGLERIDRRARNHGQVTVETSGGYNLHRGVYVGGRY